MQRTKKLTLLHSAAFGLLGLLATTTQSNEQADSYLDHPKAQAFIAEVQAEQNYPKEKLEALLASASKRQSILDAISRPAEKS